MKNKEPDYKNRVFGPLALKSKIFQIVKDF